jgi:hypothetical protein
VINQDSKEVIEFSLDPKPVQAGKEYEITESSRKSDGIALIQGFVVFVKKGMLRSGYSLGSTFAITEI